MLKQTTNHILMIRPVQFRFNEETAKNNFYQQAPRDIDAEQIQNSALKEFDNFVKVLTDHGVETTIVNDTLHPPTPDSIFPNNWISFHQDGSVIIYPMFAHNRRAEKRKDLFEILKQKGLQVTSITDYSYLEERDIFLEGTGSLILDRENKIIYAAISERMHVEALENYADQHGFETVVFRALQTVNNQRLAIYHTNVMMCLGSTFSVICLESIDNQDERNNVIKRLKETNKEIIEITEGQVSQFAGNMLELKNKQNENLLVMSSSAYQSLSSSQFNRLSKHCQLVHSELGTIEKLGGGSARCMMAEVFLPKVS